ncbi:MAG TPA: flagellar assembly protein FliW [Jatrophihabitans sp.]|uniref:flagellar assembly protein FliW n=1 Tax=Jatrophihabitans sp. TaxID=1932789 RepID=UPI002EF3FC77
MSVKHSTVVGVSVEPGGEVSALKPRSRAATLPDRITFATPIPGFEDERDFTVSALDAHGVLYALRSAKTPGLRFVVAAPGRFFPEYAPLLDASDVSALGVGDDDEVVLLVIVTVTDGLSDATANLLAPIVIAADRGTALQLVLSDADLPLRAPLLQQAG